MENLPPELFGALSEFLWANEVCWLWLSGSKRLRHLLENGITCFRHLPAQRRAYLWPSFISRFKRLQTASITSFMPHHRGQLYHSIVLGDIPASITSLKLNIPNGFLALLQPPSKGIVLPFTSLPLVPLDTMFPNLLHLEVLNVNQLAEGGKKIDFSLNPILALPLSSLHLPFAISFPTTLLKHLSPTITSLKLTITEGDVDSFPPHLVVLELKNVCGHINNSVLPRTLRSLIMDCQPRASIQFHNWPLELENLTIAHIGLALTHSHIKSLPNTLVSLIIHVLSLDFASLHELPQKLTYFYVNGRMALSAVSKEQWSQFEPKRLPPGLLNGSIYDLVQETPIERLNSFPSKVCLSTETTITSRDSMVAYALHMGPHLERLDWSCSDPEINWSFKNLKILSFGKSVHPGQVYLTLPLLPVLMQLIITRYIEDPSFALNRIVSPHFTRLSVNCHPLSPCKWDSRWFNKVTYLIFMFDLASAPKSDWFDLIASTGHHLHESSRNDILAMDKADYQDWERVGGIRTLVEGLTQPFVNWGLYASLLPRSLIDLAASSYQPMDEPCSALLTSECDWPPRLERLNACVPPRYWPSLPWALKTFSTWVQSNDLPKLAKNLDTLPKLLNEIDAKFIHSTDASSTEHLPIFTKLLQNRPHLVKLGIGLGAEMKMAPGDNTSLAGAIEATFRRTTS